MLSLNQAKKIVEKNLPKSDIQAAIQYKNEYIFRVFMSDDLEGQMDPFYSVDVRTGKFRDFSILTDGDISEITELFESSNLI